MKFVLSVMVKYTINKAFEKKFSSPIWKIEADTDARLLAIETRNQVDTTPSFHVIDFEGHSLMDDFRLKTKEWTLAEIQKDYLILKKIGANAPQASGILVVHIPSRHIAHEWHHYLLVDIFKNVLKVRHHTISAGFEEYLSLSSGQHLRLPEIEIAYCSNHINFPLAYNGILPDFLQKKEHEDTIWISKVKHNFIWCYHTRAENGYTLDILLSDKFKELQKMTVLDNMIKMIPQPYFQINEQLFLMSYNKQEIVSYLV